MPRALRALRHDETGHELGCECTECMQYGPTDVREALDCEYEPGAHQWLADFYLTVIESDRIDLYEAPQWARDLAAIGDSVIAEQRRRRRKKEQRKIRQQRQSVGATGGPRG